MGDQKRILLVDNDAMERNKLASHLLQANYMIEIVTDGAPAINKAITNHPDAIITVADMPLIDGFKLCQLLRTNPATRLIPFIFITEKETNPSRLAEFISPADDFIIRPFKIEELLGRVNNLFYRQDKVQEVSSEEDRSVSGTLTEIALVDLLQIFKMNQKTGILSLKKDDLKGIIFIRDGSVINARAGKVSADKAIFRLISWHNGTFEFKPGPTLTEIKIHQPTENLVMEGLRQYDEMNRLKGNLLKPATSISLLKQFKGPESKLRPVTREILHLIEYFNNVGDILDNSSYPDLEVHLTLNSLLEKEIIGIQKGEKEGVSPKQDRLLSLEEALKIGYYLGIGREEPTRQWKGKIAIFAQDGVVLDSFLEKSEKLPEFRRLERESRSDSTEVMLPVVKASINIMDKTSILLFNLPSLSEYEPLWRAFRKRTIGALLIASRSQDKDRYFQPVVSYLLAEKIPFASIVLIKEETAAKDGGRESGTAIDWLFFDRGETDIPRKAYRSLFKAILAS